MDSLLKILSMDCQGLGDQDKRKDVFHYLKQRKYSIYLLQDTHFTTKEENYIRSMWGFECFFDCFPSQSRGVAILLNNNFEYKLHRIKKGNDGNKIVLDITVQGRRLTIANIYGPNRDSPNFYKTLKEDIENFENEQVILGGDFNLTLNFDKDCMNYVRLNNPNARDSVLDLMMDQNLIDIWRELNLEKQQFTWRKVNPLKQARLDFFLISETLFIDVESAQIESEYRSDHSAVNLYFKFEKHEKGRSYWKFNNSLLKDPEYVKTVKNKITDIKKQYLEEGQDENFTNIPDTKIKFNINDQLFFDTLLMEIRGKTIAFSSYKKKKRY